MGSAILLLVTTPRPVLRLLSASAAALVVSLAYATPAQADVPVGWSDPPSVSMVEALLLFGLLPVGLAILITLLVVGPGLARGEGLTDSRTDVPAWLGGPNRAGTELAEVEADEAETGGASGRW